MRRAWKGLRSGVPNPVVCGRRFCPKCGKWRLIATDFGFNKRDGRFDSWCRTCKRLDDRRIKAAWTEERRAEIREYQRFWCDAKRRAAGAPVRLNRKRKVEDNGGTERLDPAPLIVEIKEWSARMERQVGLMSLDLLAERAGVEERSIRRVLVGESSHVSLDLADKLCLALDVPLAILYPYEEAA